MIRYFNNLFNNTWAESERLSIENSTFSKNAYVDRNIIFILVYIALGLSIVKYYGSTTAFLPTFAHAENGTFGSWYCNFFFGSKNSAFYTKIWWITTIVLFYLVIPILIVKCVFKKNLSEFGISFRGIYNDYPLYIIMLAVMLPVVYMASKTQSFQQRYPIFQPEAGALFPLFLWWQLAYFIQFVAVEFFFRGFIIHSLKHRFGFYSVFISTIPYCMVHFGKPFGETIAAIIAGIVLGTLSLKSRSIVLGILIHYSVAITMDLFALYREGLL
jgi:membrane protease YdiL (CAAX protease family)